MVNAPIRTIQTVSDAVCSVVDFRKTGAMAATGRPLLVGFRTESLVRR